MQVKIFSSRQLILLTQIVRFQSGFFFRHPLLDKYDYYWRIEPDVDFFCDIDYDVFKFMRNNDKKYGKRLRHQLLYHRYTDCSNLGFTITFIEYMSTIPSLWETVLGFQQDHPEVIARFPAKEKSLWDFITEDGGKSYNTCHFWTNFEIASLDLWRSNEYLKFFNYLDESGGFYYER